jgi:hypothetical protein
MTETPKRPRGRPPKPEAERKRGNLTMRLRDATRLALEDAAAANQRSLSEECEARLEYSLRDQRLFDEAIDLEYGEGTAGILALLREIIQQVANECLPRITRAPGATWMAHPPTYDQTIHAINFALEMLRPPSDPPYVADNNTPGEISATIVLLAVAEPGFAPLAKQLAEKLGPGLVDRIRAKEPIKAILEETEDDQ